MPITSSAKKALRASSKKRVFNLRRKSSMEGNLKDFRRFILAKDVASATKLVPTIYQELDKACKTGYIKANTASRVKSRVMATLKRMAK